MNSQTPKFPEVITRSRAQNVEDHICYVDWKTTATSVMYNLKIGMNEILLSRKAEVAGRIFFNSSNLSDASESKFVKL